MSIEFRIAEAHKGKEKITTHLLTHKHNPYWSYARQLSNDFDSKNIQKRTDVAVKILTNLNNTASGKYIDLSPLKDDQRAAGIIYGENPLQNAVDLIFTYHAHYPEQQIICKWGGGKPEIPGKGMVFYVEDKTEAEYIIDTINPIAEQLNIPLELVHQYGIFAYQQFVTLNDQLTSKVRNKKRFESELICLEDYPHYHHEVFD